MTKPRPETSGFLQNHLLDSLGETASAELASWLPHLEPVELCFGQVLCE